MKTLKKKTYNEVLKSRFVKEVIDLYIKDMNLIISGGATRCIKDVQEIVTPDIKQAYAMIGLKAMQPVFEGIKKLEVADVPEEVFFIAGLLENEVLVGIDYAGGTPMIALYTTNESVLRFLNTMGAFDNEDKFEKDIEQLLTKKRVAAYKSKASVPMGRIDFESMEGDKVQLKFTLPKSVRTDIGTTFKLYPYSALEFLAGEFVKYSNKHNKATNLKQEVKTVVNKGESIKTEIKERNITFLKGAVDAAYSKASVTLRNVEEIRELIEIKKEKCDCLWDPTRLLLKAYNLESSLYGQSYTTIRIQDIVSVSKCTPSKINTSQYTVDYEDLKALFKTKINSWHLADFQAFKIVPTDGFSNIPDRKTFLMNWLGNVDNNTLFKIMSTKPELFGDIDGGLATKYRLKPKAEKRMKLVKLSSDMDERIKEVTNYLRNGICKIEAVSKKGSNRVYIATNNADMLTMKLGDNYVWKFDTDKNKIKEIRKYVEQGVSKKEFEDLVAKGNLSAILPMYNLGTGDSTSQTKVLDDGLESLGSRAFNNPYLISFKRPYAETSDDFWGSVDVRRIESLEFGDVSISKG